MKKYPHLEVRISKIHRRGVFAAQDIKKGMRLIEYTGRKLTVAQADRSQSDYLFQLNAKVFIDGKNTARYINHSCDPNCEVVIIRRHIWIRSIRAIKKGEELVFNYNYDLEESKDYPCACRALRCTGYILDKYYWPILERLKKKQKVEKDAEEKTLRNMAFPDKK